MKKFILLVVSALALFCSCTTSEDLTDKYEITYVVYYPGNACTKTFAFNGDETASYRLTSYRGSNKLVVVETERFKVNNYFYLEETSAPIQVVKFVKR